MSGTLSAFTSLGVFGYPIPERSEATPGLFNQIFSGLSANLDRLNSDVSNIVGSSVGTTESILGFSSNTLRTESGNTILVQPYSTALVTTSIDSGGAFYNVRAFGAVGDGTTDDTLAFTQAHNILPLSGGVIYVPRTTSGLGYKISSAISFTKSVTLLGEGNSSLIFQSSTTADNVIVISQNSCRVANLRLRGNSLLGSTASSNVVYATASRYVTIENNSIESAGLFGIAISNCSQVRVYNNVIDNTNQKLLSSNAADIQVMSACADLHIAGNDCLSPAKTAGIQFQPLVSGDLIQYATIHDNLISRSTITSGISNGHGILLYAASSSASVQYVAITNNQIRNVAGMGIYLKGVNGGECRNCVVIGNSIFSAQLTGSNGQLGDGAITFNDARNCAVIGNIISGGGVANSSAIALIDDCSDSLVGENIISTANGFAQGGIRIFTSSSASTTASRVRVMNNSIVGPCGGAALIRTQMGTNHIYASNTLINGVTQGISLSSTSNALVYGNYTQGNGDYGVRIFSSSSSILVGFNYSINDFAPFLDQGTNTMNYDAGGLVTFASGAALAPTQAFRSEQSLGWYRSTASTIASSYGTLDLTATVASIGSLKIKAGTNNSCGTAVLGSNGSVNVANTYVKTGDLIFLTDQSPGGTLGDLEVGGIRNSSGFTIQSTSVTDTSTVAWLIVRPG